MTSGAETRTGAPTLPYAATNVQAGVAEPPPRAAAGDRRDPPGSRQWDYNFAGRSIKIEVPAFKVRLNVQYPAQTIDALSHADQTDS